MAQRGPSHGAIEIRLPDDLEVQRLDVEADAALGILDVEKRGKSVEGHRVSRPGWRGWRLLLLRWSGHGIQAGFDNPGAFRIPTAAAGVVDQLGDAAVD